MNRRIILIIFFAIIAIYMFTQIGLTGIAEKFTTIHPITAISMAIIVAYLIIRIKYKKKHTDEDKKTESTKDESSVDSNKTPEEK